MRSFYPLLVLCGLENPCFNCTVTPPPLEPILQLIQKREAFLKLKANFEKNTSDPKRLLSKACRFPPLLSLEPLTVAICRDATLANF